MNSSKGFIESHNILRGNFPEDAFYPVFVFGCAWRCGSTLMQRLISSTGEAFVWGENQGMTNHLLEINLEILQWSSLIEKQSKNYKERKLNAWIANINPNREENLITSTGAYFLYYYYPETVKLGYQRWGFKEVRHDSSHAKLLLECFPNARIIFLVRHLENVLASNAANDWYSSIGFAQGVMQMWVKNVSSFVKINDQRILLIKYEDLVENTETIFKQIEKHLILKNNIDINIMNHRVRAANMPPCLHDEEKEILKDTNVTELLNTLGYSS